ncbi:S1C family serine protease [Dermatobacter hominis]|uniref:S1C family serine protease n=1 Tax=Dermatobacter hominis TaxID=2884263 RepID=UPI001D0FEAAE|nr:trypsin-like peptidase domain-containing protein [Dermatobacter hominis]UDY37040.1 S1C family serine protease [Dermatobacter hominis]
MTIDNPLAELSSAARTAAAASAASTVGIGRRGRGTGIVVDTDRVLTNVHNLRDRTTQVTFADGRTAQGRVLGADPDRDLVVLDVSTDGAPAIEWSDRTLDVGDTVFAGARGTRGHRVSFGLVSSSDRSFRGQRGRRVKGAVEHTAPLARGSSGGPLLDVDGRLVGINTARLGEGFYLAQPTDTDLRGRVDQLIAGEHLGGRRLGVAIVGPDETRRLRRQVGLPDQDGLLIRSVVPDSAAAQAGLGEGDLVIAVDGTAVRDVDDVWDALDAGGDTVDVSVLRGADERTVTVSFAEPPADEEPAGS